MDLICKVFRMMPGVTEDARKGRNGRDTVHDLLATSLERDQLQLRPALYSAHLAVTYAPIIRTAAKSQAKINSQRLTARNFRCYGLSRLRTLTQGPHSVRYKGS